MSNADLARLIAENIQSALAEPNLQRKWATLLEAKQYFDRLSNSVWHDYLKERAALRPRDLS